MLAELECYKMSLSGAEKKSNFLQSLDPDWDDYIGALKECGSMEELLIKAAAEARRRSTHNHGGAQAVSSGNAFAALSYGTPGAQKGNQDSGDEAEMGFFFQVSTQAAVADWIINSGTSSHMTGTSDLRSDLYEMASDVIVTTASDTTLTATHGGKAYLPLTT
ncbi:hypothetical protein PF005_g2583 [Phytophthora fragariae]|uniref:Uncharacterized protein n=2 Tax=Phytophthora fragariae TaxID=53985 RepID=A0A6A4AE52_9STRA|nr:hypothetical protein PF005_g2583 [Phytophthora fragariae]KAE9253036.1 hypothetical protein PF002_g3538 [Phytophthora fragariae]